MQMCPHQRSFPRYLSKRRHCRENYPARITTGFNYSELQKASLQKGTQVSLDDRALIIHQCRASILIVVL